MAGIGKIEFKVSVLGEVQLQRALAGRLANVADLSPAFEKIADLIFEGERKAFDAEGGYEGNPAWAPLSEKYAAWKAKKYPGAKILERTGKLREMMTGGSGSLKDISPHRMELRFGGLRVGRWDLGALHQTGTTRGMPARKPLLLSRRQRSGLMRILAIHINQERREAAG